MVVSEESTVQFAQATHLLKLVGTVALLRSSTRLGSGLVQFCEKIWPKSESSLLRELHLELFRTSPFSNNLSRHASSALS